METTSKTNLDQQFSGVSTPQQMGTTGLVAYVLHGSKLDGRNRWQRFQIAKAIIKNRGLSLPLFVDAIMGTAFRHGINMKRFFAATRKITGNRTMLRPEYYTFR